VTAAGPLLGMLLLGAFLLLVLLKDRFPALARHEAPLIGILAADGTIRYLSPASRQLLGHDPADLVGRNALSLIHPDDAAAVGAALQAGLEHRDTGETLTFRVRHHGGAWRVVEGVDTNLLGVPAVDGIVVNLRDITERTAAEDALALLNQALEQRVGERTAELAAANQELESFSYSVSHDLRAPLRHIRQFARNLVEDHAGALESAVQRDLHRIEAAAEHADELVEALLDLSRLARAEMHRAPVDLGKLAQEILSELRRVDPDRRVETVIANGMVVDGDRGLLRVVLDNLLGNAWKYTAQHAQARIEVGLFEEHRVPVFFVRDDGAGFDMAYAERLFVPFQRLHAQREFEGIGVGLATVQRIIHRHGGQVWADAAVEKGATIYFTLRGGHPGRRIVV